MQDLPKMNDELVGAKEIAVNSCPTSQVQSKGASEPSAIECSAMQGVLACDATDNACAHTESLERSSTAEENKVISDEKVKKLLGDATECDRVRKDVDQYKKKGGFEKAKEDFYSMGLDNIIEQDNDLIIGLLPDGRTVNVRPDSKGNGPTLEIYAGREAVKIKIRY